MFYLQSITVTVQNAQKIISYNYLPKCFLASFFQCKYFQTCLNCCRNYNTATNRKFCISNWRDPLLPPHFSKLLQDGKNLWDKHI